MALVKARIHTFRDDNKIGRGENIKNEIERAMLQESKISIIVFSKNYASSTWCLNELVKIMEHRKFSKQIVLPIFYDVNPSQVQNKLHHTTLYVPPYIVGIDCLVTCINSWLGDRSNKVGIATICRIRGIGKTTIAKVVYNLNIQRFESYSYLSDVRDITQERNGLVRLQRQLILDILKGKANKIHNSDDGITKIKEAICRRRVLIVLDDVDDSEKITEIIGAQIPFHPRSKIIITSRHQCLLSDAFIMQMFDLEASSSYGDLCKNDPIDSYVEYARSVVKHYGGLPLALQVLGSSLYACVFIRKDRDYTTIILDRCDYYTAIGIENLINRSFLVVNEKNKLMMYQMIKDIGDFKDFSKSLIWLSWHGFLQEYLPTNLDISKLVVLEMHNSSLKRIWNHTKYVLPNLKILNLSDSHALLKILNLSSLHSLEKLMLKDCIKLIEVDQSIGEIKAVNSRKLPRTIGSLESLGELILSGCSTLNDVPRDLQNLKSLRVLNLDGTAICESNS
ncbi:Toll/interleukin-1 receptor homology (TIR) domain - like 10, partial [Theobroma cacao]